MTKEEVISENVQAWVLAPVSVECSFSAYWKSLNADTLVQVKYAYERHGLCGKPSNHGKAQAKEAFLKFVDNNIQPNGRHAGSYGPQYYFLPQFTRIDLPKIGEVNSEQKAKSSFVSEFNHTQIEARKSTISGFTVSQEMLHHPNFIHTKSKLQSLKKSCKSTSKILIKPEHATEILPRTVKINGSRF